MSFRTFYQEYKSTLYFSLILTVCVVLSHWLSRYIPVDYFNNTITPVMNVMVMTICLSGAWMIFRHSGGMRIRLAWGTTLVVWGGVGLLFLLLTYGFKSTILTIGDDQLTLATLFASDLLGWVMVLYPTEVLRPGWMTYKRAIVQLLPLLAIALLDSVTPYDLRFLAMLYPLGLLGLLIIHIRAYANWCEENFSTLDDIDVQWIWRYLYMLLLAGASLLYMCITDNPTRAFTQQWLFVFFFVYSTEQIAFRRDPWKMVHPKDSEAEEAPHETASDETNTSYREALEQWMDSKKPYLNTEFRLLDLREVLPLNRTYLSQFISTTYGCNFYQFVARYRVEEAKRLMTEHPDMKLQDVAEKSGFSSPAALSHIFSRETGLTPSEWSKKFVSA